MSKNILIKELKKAGIVKTGNFILKSGQQSNIYFDLKGLVSFPNLLFDVSYEISKFISEDDIIIGGVPLGAISYACIVSQIKKLPMILIRENKKTYGLQKCIEGNTFNKDLILIEDVVTTGASILKTIELVESEGVKIRKIIVILDRENAGLNSIREKGYPMEVLFKMSELLEN